MSGILDNKTRIIDAMLTAEGRRQLGAGTLNISYATFGDKGVIYSPDQTNGHEDPTKKIYLEATSLPQDQIIFEANDDGRLNPMRVQGVFIKPPGDKVSTELALSTIKDGKVLVSEIFHGRRIVVSSISQVYSDLDLGFSYSDYSGVSANILVNPYLDSGLISTSTPPGGPYSAYIGTKGGLIDSEFAKQISNAINALSAGGGPSVVASSQNNNVFLDAGSSVVGNKSQLLYTGSLSSPIRLEEAALGGSILTDEVEDAVFASQITGILSSSFDNFVELGIISTIDRQIEDDQFSVDKKEVTFHVEKIDELKVSALCKAPPELNSIDSLFNDDKLSHLENFMYLPPIVKGALPQVSFEMSKEVPNMSNVQGYMLGNYPSWGDNEKKLTYSGLIKQLNGYESIDVIFDKTSGFNNVIGQFFEVAGNTVTKLDVVDFGTIRSNISDDPYGDSRRVLFIGKVYVDNRGATCFVNMFTVISSRIRREEQ